MDVVDWTSIVTGADDGYELTRPADAVDLERAQLVLGTRFPPLLRALYETTDGIFDAPGQWDLVWPIDVLIAENLRAYRDDGSPRDEYVGFGDDGTGNPFCVRRDEGDAVYYWNPILHESTLLGDDLLSFWRRYNDGTLPPH